MLSGHELREAIALSEDHLRELVGASILLTGATGWFGTWLLDYLTAADEALELGIHVTCLSRDPAKFLERFGDFGDLATVTWIKGDVRTSGPFDRQFTHVIHAATDSTATAALPSGQEQFDVIVNGTRRMLDCAGAHCRSFLMVSSGAVYGPAKLTAARFMDGQTGVPSQSLPPNVYAEGKRAAEQLCAIACGTGVPVRVARCFAFVGPHMPLDKHFAIGNFIADAVCGRCIQIKSDGRPQRSYMYMSDLVRALICVLVNGAVGRTYNVGSDVPLRLRDLAECVNRVVGGRGVIVVGDRSDPWDRYVPDTTRLREELRFASSVPLDLAIARTAAWFRDAGIRRNSRSRSMTS
jgi:dTDP-glucose 4,6-dehydratase